MTEFSRHRARYMTHGFNLLHVAVALVAIKNIRQWAVSW
jgi:hypothetical protein